MGRAGPVASPRRYSARIRPIVQAPGNNMPRMMLTQPLHRASRLHPQRVATCCADRTRPYAELSDRVARLAAALLELGLQPGERVGVLAQNSYRYIAALFAVWQEGGAINHGNTRWSARELAFSMHNCDTHLDTKSFESRRGVKVGTNIG